MNEMEQYKEWKNAEARSTRFLERAERDRYRRTRMALRLRLRTLKNGAGSARQMLTLV